MEISVPPSLSQADAALGLVAIFQQILDPNERKKIADDVVAFHKLNDTEAKQAKEDRELIKEHAIMLENIRRESDALEKNKFDFELKSKADREFIVGERAKIDTNAAKAAAEANETLAAAKKLHDEISEKEKRISAMLLEHENSVKKLEQDKIALGKREKEIEEYHKVVKEMENETRLKVEKLKQFNF